MPHNACALDMEDTAGILIQYFSKWLDLGYYNYNYNLSFLMGSHIDFYWVLKKTSSMVDITEQYLHILF